MKMKKTFGRRSIGSSTSGSGRLAVSVPVITIIHGGKDQEQYSLDLIKVRDTTTNPWTSVDDVVGDASLYVDKETEFTEGIGIGRLATDGSVVWVANPQYINTYCLFAGDKIISTATIDVTGGFIPETVPPERFYFKAYLPEVVL